MTDMPQQTDEEIASRVQHGDTDAFGALVERYDAKIARYARRFLSDEEGAKDVVQEVFIKAYVNIRSFDPARKFSAWLYRIAHNEFVNELKRMRREPVSFIDLDELYGGPASPQTSDAPARRAEVRRQLEKHLRDLGPRYREPLVLYYFEELEYGEIADILHIPVSTVGVRLKRGREALKKAMGGEWDPKGL